MAQGKRKKENNTNQGGLALNLHRERKAVGDLLFAFEVNGVNALIIMEKEDTQIIMGKSIARQP